MKKQKRVKVKLESGFVGYVLGDEFFIIGSIVDCFDRVPEHFKEWCEVVREEGVVVEIY